jgi:metallo-beta-lactamase class B
LGGALVSAVALLLLGRWANANKIGGQGPAEPFRIAGNFYYVGATDASAFLLTGPDGHVVIDAGYPTTARLVMASIAKLGFDIRDVKILLNSEPHPDHGGGLQVIQDASGAQLWTSEASAYPLASGGDDADGFLALRAATWLGLVGFPPARVDHQFKDGETIRLGPIALTAHITAGHTRGSTSYSFKVQDGDRTLNVVSVSDITVLSLISYPEQSADRERSIKLLRSLPADIWVTNHARAWGRYRKFAASSTMPNPVDAFIDPEGYRAFIDKAEEELRTGIAH